MAAARETQEALGRQFIAKNKPSEAVKSGAAVPVGPNPWLSLMPGEMRSEVDWAYWREVVAARAEARAGNPFVSLGSTQPIAVAEQEPANVSGQNDSQESAEFILGVGTGRRQAAQANISGALAELPAPVTVGPFAEDEGSIPLASPVEVAEGTLVRAEAEIGDGPHGSAAGATGDADFYQVTLSAGDRLFVDTDTTDASPVDTVVLVWDAEGIPIAFNDDDGTSLDSRLTTTVPADGDYFISVEDFNSFLVDPFDSGSGIGVGNEGPYSIEIGRNIGDVDHYSFNLKAGDVVSASVTDGASEVTLLSGDGTVVMGSTQDASGIYPADTQLTGGGNAVLDHVAAETGRYTLRVAGTEGSYDATARLLRPGLETGRRRSPQTVFLDFDGAEVNTGIFGGPGVRQLSPMAAFIEGWGLAPEDEDALIDQIMATVEENMELEAANAGVRVSLRNSRDDRDQFGTTNWSRVIVGGSIAESGIGTIGIAQSIDPGNYETEETALVLLDILSDPGADFGDPSLNSYITSETDVIEFVGRAIGNIVAHEIGHYIGNWHVEQFNETTNLMDQGGNFPVLYGVGPDGIGGTADDVDVDFGEDMFNSNEGFVGTENTAVRSGYGLSYPRGRVR